MGIIEAPALLDDRPVVVRHRINAQNYYRMAENGILPPDARVELIEGEILDMPPMGTRHRTALVRLDHLLRKAVGTAAMVMNQVPLRLDEFNETEPDLLLLPHRDDFYADIVIAPEHTWLVVEVADSTRAYDLRIKTPLYARAGVSALWVLDLQGRRLHSFTAPLGGLWTVATVQERPGLTAVPGLDGIEVDLTGLV
jgi:Uma2 family endonuclease